MAAGTRAGEVAFDFIVHLKLWVSEAGQPELMPKVKKLATERSVNCTYSPAHAPLFRCLARHGHEEASSRERGFLAGAKAHWGDNWHNRSGTLALLNLVCGRLWTRASDSSWFGQAGTEQLPNTSKHSIDHQGLLYESVQAHPEAKFMSRCCHAMPGT